MRGIFFDDVFQRVRLELPNFGTNNTSQTHQEHFPCWGYSNYLYSYLQMATRPASRSTGSEEKVLDMNASISVILNGGCPKYSHNFAQVRQRFSNVTVPIPWENPIQDHTSIKHYTIAIMYICVPKAHQCSEVETHNQLHCGRSPLCEYRNSL